MMNKVITDGLVLMPPAFADGLDVWSSGDGTPGSDTYAGSGTGVFVPADQDFGGCIEISKANSVQKLRYMGATPILPGCYLRVTARVKAVSGALPNVRIAGFPLWPDGSVLGGVTKEGPEITLTAYGEVVEISAIIGTGPRGGVDMVWSKAGSAHIGLDLTGPSGGLVRIDDIRIEDVTGAFLRDMMGVVDVRDYGAVGDGVTDDRDAFEAADLDADGREVLVSAGTYFLGDNVTIQNQIRFEGTVTMAPDHRLVFQKNFDFATYADAFGDEELAFKKAFQALLNFSDHESLDLCGRRISLSEPVDAFAAVVNKPAFEVRRVIRNGQLQPDPGAAWDTEIVTSQASYSVASARTLTNVVNAASIPVGALVTGNGVGREVYVKAVDVPGQEVTLSSSLFDAEGTQVFTFTRFKYLLDFSGFDRLSALELEDIDFHCKGIASCVMLAPDGHSMRMRDCQFNKPKDRAITSPGTGCNGLDIFGCVFNSNEQSLPLSDRTTLCFNINHNDATVRNNRAARFKHFGVLGGNGNLITGNHWYMGDNETQGVRQAGIILTSHNCVSTITANYIDNSFVELTNEHDAHPDAQNEYTFGGLTMTGNICVCSDVAPWFSWIVVKPYGQNHSIQGLNVSGNVFRTYSGNIDRVEHIDTTYADLDFNTMRNITFSGNVFNGVNEQVRNPYSDIHNQQTEDSVWIVDTGTFLPFGGWTRTIESVEPVQAITNSSGQTVFHQPYIDPVNGANTHEFRVVWPEPVKGKIRFCVRMDNPA